MPRQLSCSAVGGYTLRSPA